MWGYTMVDLERKDLQRYSDPLKRAEYLKNRSREYMQINGYKYRKKTNEKRKNRWKNSTLEYKRKMLDLQIKKYALVQDKLLQIKKANKCNHCGYNLHPEILQFHHRDKEHKDFALSGGNLCNRKWEIILKEIDKCDILCPNCHHWLHYNEKEFFVRMASHKKITDLSAL